MDTSGLGRILVVAGGLTLLVGLLVLLGGRMPFLGRLPGDFVFERDGLTVFVVPIATMLLVSIALTVVLNVASRFFR